jgi:hypothetical protein
MPRYSTVSLTLETDTDISVRGFADDGDIQVCFRGGGFVRAGILRHALDKGKPREVIERGPVTILVHDPKAPDIDLHIDIPRGGQVNRRLKGEVCEEIIERIDQVRSLLHSYARDEEAMERADERRAAKRLSLAAAV